MKKILFALLSLSAASLAFAGGETKGDDKDSKGCCCSCCSCCKDDKACTDKAAGDVKADATTDAKPADTPAKK